jgi:hypothetical protein
MIVWMRAIENDEKNNCYTILNLCINKCIFIYKWSYKKSNNK